MFQLYLITDDRSDPEALTPVLRALQGARRGRVGLQLRKKRWPARRLLEAAEVLQPACRRAGVPLLINERADIAQLAAADGVHLPEGAIRPEGVRRLLGGDALVGVSCHDAQGLAAAAQQAASFATLSPVFASPGKGRPLGLSAFARLAGQTHLPTFGLGGLGPDQVDAVMGSGAAGVAVVRAVFAAPDPAAALERLLDSVSKA